MKFFIKTGLPILTVLMFSKISLTKFLRKLVSFKIKNQFAQNAYNYLGASKGSRVALAYLCTLFIYSNVSNELNAQASVCVPPPPAPHALCTPPSSFDVNVTVPVGDTVDWQTLTGISADNVTQKIKISGGGKVIVPNGDLLLKSSTSVVYLDGVELVINNGNLQLTTSDARFLMNGGILRTFGNFQQTSETVVCINGAKLEIGEEEADGIFNTTGNNNSAANWQNDGGYRYLNGVCVNVTQDYQLQSSGSGQGISGRDVIINCCFEIGDRGLNHATPTAFQNKDGDDSGNWQNSRRMFIYGTDIVLANGNFQNSNDTMTVCDVDVKINVTGSFQINSGYLIGDGLCVAAEDLIENSSVWSANIQSWYSFKQNSLTQNQPITGTIPAESTQAAILASCFTKCCVDCVKPSGIAMTQAAPTCSGSTPNNNGSISLTAISNADKFGVSTGGTYTGPAYAAATAIGSLPQVLQNSIPNAGAAYTIRFFNGGDDCFKDTTVTVAAIHCCQIEVVSAIPGACVPASNEYALMVQITYANAPSGNITIQTSNGANHTFTPNGSGSEIITLTGLTADGVQDIDVTAFFVNNHACTHTLMDAYDAPVACSPPPCPVPNCLPVTVQKN